MAWRTSVEREEETMEYYFYPGSMVAVEEEETMEKYFYPAQEPHYEEELTPTQAALMQYITQKDRRDEHRAQCYALNDQRHEQVEKRLTLLEDQISLLTKLICHDPPSIQIAEQEADKTLTEESPAAEQSEEQEEVEVLTDENLAPSFTPDHEEEALTEESPVATVDQKEEVLHFEQNEEFPLTLGCPSLETTRTLITVHKGELPCQLGNREVNFDNIYFMNTSLPFPSYFVEKDNPPTGDSQGGEILMSLPAHIMWKNPQKAKLSILLRRRKESSYWKS